VLLTYSAFPVWTTRALLGQRSGWWVVVHEEKLSSVLSEFAHTLATDFPIQAILDHLVERIVGILPITAAGVTLITPGSAPHYIAASDQSALRYERLQTAIGEGPCLAAYQSGEAVAIPDLRLDDRFPNFGPAALEAGLLAVFTFPLREGDGQLGALDLYRDSPGDLDKQDMAAAQTLADVAAAYLLNAKAVPAQRVARSADWAAEPSAVAAAARTCRPKSEAVQDVCRDPLC
jgi:GAF domain-containing protein